MVIENLQYISIFVEALIAVLGLFIVFLKKKSYGIGIFTTFFIYVFYDLVRLENYSVSQDVLSILFFIASISMLLVAWVLLKDYFQDQKNRRKI